MQYNYNTGGIQLDFGAIQRSREMKAEKEAAEKAAEALREKNKRFQSSSMKFEETRDPKYMREMLNIDPDKALIAQEIQTTLDKDAKQSLADITQEIKSYMDNDRPDLARAAIIERKDFLERYNSSTHMTAPLAQAAMDLDDAAFGDVVNGAYDVGLATGLIEEPKREGWVNEGTFFAANGDQYIKFRKPDNTFQNVKTGDTRQGIEEARMRNASMGGDDDLPQNLGKYRVDLVDKATGLRGRAGQAGQLKNRFDNAIAEGIDPLRKGTVGNVYDKVLGIVGEEDALSFLRTEADNLLAKEVVALLPKGPASDKDVALMQKAVPNAYSNPEEFKKWLEAYERLSNQSAEGAELRSVWVEQTRSAASAARAANIRGIDIKKGEEFRDFRTRYEKKKKEQEEKIRKAAERERRLQQTFDDMNNTGGGANEFEGFSIVR